MRKKDFISFFDDNGEVKNKHVIIIKRDISGVEFKFEEEENKSIFIPMHRLLKIKEEKEK